MENVQKNPIGWVEIPVSDMDRAEKFYGDYFGFEMARQPEKGGYEMSWFPMDMAGYGAAGMLMKGEHYTPSMDGALIYFTAPGGTVEKGLEIAAERGIEVLVPKTNIGEHGFFAVLADSEGNKFAIHSMKG